MRAVLPTLLLIAACSDGSADKAEGTDPSDVYHCHILEHADDGMAGMMTVME